MPNGPAILGCQVGRHLHYDTSLGRDQWHQIAEIPKDLFTVILYSRLCFYFIPWVEPCFPFLKKLNTRT